MSDPVQALQAGQAVTIEVPATSANLGPGFDCFGLALDWRESIHLEVIESGFLVEVSGEGAEQIPRDESHLIMRSALVGLADLGFSAPGLRLSGHNTIPHGRGLGSSSAAIVAGLLAASSLVGRVGDLTWLLRHSDAIEGHPDNVAAAIHGGFVMAYDGSEGIAVAEGVVADGLSVVLYIPESPVATHAARNLLPDQVPHSDAASNAGRSALFAHAMAVDPDLLWDATRDWLHQDYRQRAMPASYDLMVSLRSQGLAAVISGAGPSVLVIGRSAELAQLPETPVRGFTTRSAGIGTGARLVDATTPKNLSTRQMTI